MKLLNDDELITQYLTEDFNNIELNNYKFIRYEDHNCVFQRYINQDLNIQIISIQDIINGTFLKLLQNA